MAREQYNLPECLLEGAKLLLPNVDLSRIRFYMDHNQRDWDTTSFLTHSEIRVSMSAKHLSPCDPEIFKALCHELVHVLQAQGFWNLIRHRAASWACYVLYWGNHRDEANAGNCVEREAYNYEDLVAEKLKIPAVPPSQVVGFHSPCLCRPRPGDPFVVSDALPIGNPEFASVVAGRPELIKRAAGCSPTSCIRRGVWNILVGYPTVYAATGLSIATVFATGWASLIGSYVGAASGVMIGGLIGATWGAFGLRGVSGAFVGGSLGAVIGGWALGLVGAIIGAIGRLFGQGGGSLNVMFSTDGAVSWRDKATFERSSEPMSLAFGQLSVPTPAGPSYNQSRLSVAWTGTDDNVNLLTLPQKRRIDFPLSDKCGPAVVNSGVRVHLVWQGTDHALNIHTTWNGQTLHTYSYLGDTRSPADASPALCFTGARYVLTYIGTDRHINLLSSPNGIDEWGFKLILNETAQPETTVPVVAIDNYTVMIAWTGEDDHLNVMELRLGLDGAFTPVYKNTLGERSSDEAGPALCYRAPYLYLAWTGTDGQLNLMTSDNRGHSFFGHGVFERSRKDCGPALAIHTDGTMCIGWVGTD